MKQVIIDGAAIADRQALHRTLADKLALPEWYGSNLDALFDCLTDLSEDIHIAVTHFDALEETLGSYAQSFRKVLLRAAKENLHIHLHLM